MSVQAVADKPHRPTTKKPVAETEAVLGRVVGVIVHQFKGDTSAFFDSIRSNRPLQGNDDTEVRLVRRFAKSL